MNNITEKYPVGISTRQLGQTRDFIRIWATLDSPVSMEAIAIQIQSTPRTARECVKILREKGKPIGSNGSGYWWANDADQLEPAIKYAKSHRDSHALTVDFLEKTQEEMIMTEQLESA